MRPPGNPQHSGTIVNGISRIGFMAGGRRAWWVDEDMSDRFVSRAIQFIRENRDRPFFLFLSLRDVHVPRLPHSRFVGKSGLGLRGDAIVEMDWMVGAIADELADLGLGDNTLLIFTSDNGPVIDDGYDDGALEALGDHDPSGPYRGGKYQAWEGGTRMPFIVHWPGRVSPGVSAALVSQVDLAASLVSLAGGSVPAGAAPDSENVLPALLGESERGREHLIQQGVDAIAIRRRDWKFIDAGARSAWAQAKHDRPGDTTKSAAMPESAQLYNLADDPGEARNVLAEHADIARELKELLHQTLRHPQAHSDLNSVKESKRASFPRATTSSMAAVRKR